MKYMQGKSVFIAVPIRVIVDSATTPRVSLKLRSLETNTERDVVLEIGHPLDLDGGRYVLIFDQERKWLTHTDPDDGQQYLWIADLNRYRETIQASS